MSYQMARSVAEAAWGSPADGKTLIKDVLWEFSTPGHGGFVRAFPTLDPPRWAKQVGRAPGCLRKVPHQQMTYVAFDEDEGWAVLLANDAQACEAVYWDERRWKAEQGKPVPQSVDDVRREAEVSLAMSRRIEAALRGQPTLV